MKRNKFNNSHYKVGTMPLGFLVPISCYEVLPGDTVQMSTNIFFRLAPMVNPSFAILKARWYHFFVPFRLCWNGWENYRTGGPDGLDVSSIPTVTFSAGTQQGRLADYLGVPVGFTDKLNLLPFRAYYKIYYDYFRDQDLINFDMTTGANRARFTDEDGDFTFNQNGEFRLFHSAWEKDYFTTARPWPQKGAEINVPVNSPTGGISLSASGNPTFKAASGTIFPDSSTTSGIHDVTAHRPDGTQGSDNIQLYTKTQQGTVVDNSVLQWDNPNLTINTASGDLGSVKLNDLREAFALQRFEEARAMYGSRYTEYLRYLGVRSSDARLQRPEYLGGGRTTLQISEVLQTGEDGSNPVGTLRGHGVGAGRSKRFRRFIEEDGVIMTLLSVRPVPLYAQGLPKMFSRTVKEDYWTKELQHIGQQEVMTRELYAGADADTVFGYQNRYDDYRSIPSTVCGQMRPSGVDEDWTMARIFNNEPVLNQDFIDATPSLRNFAEQNYDPLYFMASHSVVMRRLMSKTGNPIL